MGDQGGKEIKQCKGCGHTRPHPDPEGAPYPKTEKVSKAGAFPHKAPEGSHHRDQQLEHADIKGRLYAAHERHKEAGDHKLAGLALSAAKAHQLAYGHHGISSEHAPGGFYHRHASDPAKADASYKKLAGEAARLSSEAHAASHEYHTATGKGVSKAGPGSRGGKVAYHTKSGKPVYQSAVKRRLPQFRDMMHNWHKNASQSGDPEHHATAAKQALAHAFNAHHAGQSIDAQDAMDYAEHHRGQYQDKGHSSRTTKWVDKNYDATHALVHGSKAEKPASSPKPAGESVKMPKREHAYWQHSEKTSKAFEELEAVAKAESEGKPLNKPQRSSGGPKKYHVFTKNESGRTVKVNFGDPNMEIKRDDPDRRKNFRARHNCDDPGPKTKARYWSCKMWSDTPVSKITKSQEDEDLLKAVDQLDGMLGKGGRYSSRSVQTKESARTGKQIGRPSYGAARPKRSEPSLVAPHDSEHLSQDEHHAHAHLYHAYQAAKTASPRDKEGQRHATLAGYHAKKYADHGGDPKNLISHGHGLMGDLGEKPYSAHTEGHSLRRAASKAMEQLDGMMKAEPEHWQIEEALNGRRRDMSKAGVADMIEHHGDYAKRHQQAATLIQRKMQTAGPKAAVYKDALAHTHRARVAHIQAATAHRNGHPSASSKTREANSHTDQVVKKLQRLGAQAPQFRQPIPEHYRTTSWAKAVEQLDEMSKAEKVKVGTYQTHGGFRTKTVYAEHPEQHHHLAQAKYHRKQAGSLNSPTYHQHTALANAHHAAAMAIGAEGLNSVGHKKVKDWISKRTAELNNK
jgi:hypothetical protein